VYFSKADRTSSVLITGLLLAEAERIVHFFVRELDLGDREERNHGRKAENVVLDRPGLQAALR
jgi:hypothetical protein